MRPSGSLTCEPGIERGVPWGRDLFTFVTSAAGHMMRTLQRPRKNRPSKRQVNHRRFLHNMIHRKFAEIEAANRQLASALFAQDKENLQALSPHQVVLNDQSEETPKEESATSLATPPFPLLTTSPGFSIFTPDNTNFQTVQEDQGDLWSFSIQLDSPVPEMVQSSKTPNKDTNIGAVRTAAVGADCRFNKPEETPDFEPRFDIQPDVIRADTVERLTNNLAKENAISHSENFQNCGRFSEVHNSGLHQTHTARSLSPGMGVAAVKPLLPFLLEPPSLASCAVGIHIISDSSCSQTDMNTTPDNLQPEALDNFCPVDLDGDVRDSINPQFLSMSSGGAQEEELQDHMLHFGRAFLTYSNNFTDSTEYHQFDSEAISPARVHDTTMTPSGNSRSESPFSCSDPFHSGYHGGSRSQYLDPISNISSHMNMEHTTESKYCSQHNMEQRSRTFRLNESDSSDMEYFTTQLTDLVGTDQSRLNEGEQCVNAVIYKKTRGSYSHGPTKMYGRASEGEMPKEAELPFIPKPQDSCTHEPRYRCNRQSIGTGSAQTFPKLFYSTQGASECTLKDSAEQAGLEAFDCLNPFSDIFQNQSYNPFGHHFIGPAPVSLQNGCSRTQTTTSSIRSGPYRSSNRFVGVARSFPAPSPKTHLHQILTPPLEEGWLFDDITDKQVTGTENCLLRESTYIAD